MNLSASEKKTMPLIVAGFILFRDGAIDGNTTYGDYVELVNNRLTMDTYTSLREACDKSGIKMVNQNIEKYVTALETTEREIVLRNIRQSKKEETKKDAIPPAMLLRSAKEALFYLLYLDDGFDNYMEYSTIAGKQALMYPEYSELMASLQQKSRAFVEDALYLSLGKCGYTAREIRQGRPAGSHNSAVNFTT